MCPPHPPGDREPLAGRRPCSQYAPESVKSRDHVKGCHDQTDPRPSTSVCGTRILIRVRYTILIRPAKRVGLDGFGKGTQEIESTCKDRSSGASISRFAVVVSRFEFAVGTGHFPLSPPQFSSLYALPAHAPPHPPDTLPPSLPV